MAEFDPSRLSKLDWVVVGAGGAAFIDSFLPWYRVTTVFGLGSASLSAWGIGFAAWFSVLLLAAAAGLLVTRAFGTEIPLPVPVPVATLGAAALAVLLILLRWLTLPRSDVIAASAGAGFGLYLGLLLAIASGVASYLTFRAGGGDLKNLLPRSGGAPPQQ